MTLEPRSMVKNASDKEQVKTAAQREKSIAERDQDDLIALLKTTHGRRFIWRLLEKSNVFLLSFAAGHPDVTNFNEGRRAFGTTILTEVINASPEAYLQMMQESKGEKDV